MTSIHTPESDDYGKGPNRETLKKRTPREWLLDYMRAGIDCVAITYHSSGAWVDRVKTAFRELESEQPEGFRPVLVFPGIEIPVNGAVHLLAILGCEKTTSDIDSLLGAAGFSGTKGPSNAVTRKSFVGVVDAVASAGGISIPAHVDEDNGPFQVTGTTLRQVLDCEDIFAMELMNPAYQKPQFMKTTLRRCHPMFLCLSTRPVCVRRTGRRCSLCLSR